MGHIKTTWNSTTHVFSVVWAALRSKRSCLLLASRRGCWVLTSRAPGKTRMKIACIQLACVISHGQEMADICIEVCAQAMLNQRLLCFQLSCPQQAGSSCVTLSFLPNVWLGALSSKNYSHILNRSVSKIVP
eukprot:1157024-Pelagomonas_calceolata.AAC.4